MYISCGDDGAGVESEMGYVPNNPLFGLPLDSPQVSLYHSYFIIVISCICVLHVTAEAKRSGICKHYTNVRSGANYVLAIVYYVVQFLCGRIL